MAEYLLSVYTVKGETREPMTDERMQELMRKIGELEEEMVAADALVYSGRLSDADTARVVRCDQGETLVTDWSLRCDEGTDRGLLHRQRQGRRGCAFLGIKDLGLHRPTH